MQFGTVQVVNLSCQYLSATQLAVTCPGGLTAGDVQFFYAVGGSSLPLPFTVPFQ